MNQKETTWYTTNRENTIDIVYLENVTTSYPLHTHAQHYTLGIVEKGEVHITTPKGEYVCGPSCMFHIPMDVPHSVKPQEGGFYTTLTVCINKDYLNHTEVDCIRDAVHEELCKTGCSEEQIKRYSDLISDGLTLVFANILEELTEETYTATLKQMLLELPENPITIEDMAHEICVSPFHLIRQFQKEIGLTPHQFQMQCRVRKSQKLLLSDKTIAEVALDAGFYDQSHFVRCFKKLVGMTPTAYKRRAKISKERE